MAIFLFLALLLGFNPYSSATYCICMDGLSDSVLQTDIDYACGAGADCSAILQTGACYQPNTVKAHCDYAVNSYYQRQDQVSGSCDFSGSATTSSSLPSTVVSGCTYPASPSQAAANATTPTSSTGTPTTTAGTPTSSTTTTGTPTSSTTPGSYDGSGLSPTGATDSSAHASSPGYNFLFLSSTFFLLSWSSVS